MMILAWVNRKNEEYWDASTPEKEKAAFRRLFENLEEWGCYADFDPGDLKASEKMLADLREAMKELEKSSLACVKALREEKEAELHREEREFARIILDADIYKKAKAGDDKALRRLLESRKGHEYEEWQLIDVTDPLEAKK
jgi:hypothetical protein